MECVMCSYVITPVKHSLNFSDPGSGAPKQSPHPQGKSPPKSESSGENNFPAWLILK